MGNLDAPSIVAIACVLACFVWWWLALSIMRSAQFKGEGRYENAASASAVPPSTAPGIVGAYDNHNPDKSKEQLTGYGRRAMLTMNNHAEQFGFFAAAVLFNVACRGPSNGSWEVAGLSLAYAFLRLLHLVFYVTDAAGVRSLAFFVGQLVLFVLWGFVFAA